MYKKGDKGHLKHGLRNTRLYRIWANIKTRCYNENVQITTRCLGGD